MKLLYYSKMRLSSLLLLLIAALANSVPAQGSRQNPSPMTETTRPHKRIEKVEPIGKRVPLESLKGATAFVNGKLKAVRSVPLIVHFHGAPWLIESHVTEHRPSAVLITVQLGAGSSAYGTPFKDAGLFGRMISEAGRELGLKREWSSITLTGFSAGYGAVRAILRDPENYKLVDNVLLLDGIHAGYFPEQRSLQTAARSRPLTSMPLGIVSVTSFSARTPLGYVFARCSRSTCMPERRSYSLLVLRPLR